MWEINVIDQIFTFGLSLCLGAFLCVVYDVIRALRKTGLDSFVAVFVTDIIFWLFSALITFIFLMSRTNGEIRGYVILGALIGFVLLRISVSKILFAVLNLVFVFIVKIKIVIADQIYKAYDKIECVISQILRCGFHFFKRLIKSVKKLLKKWYRVLYTNKNNANMENVLDETKT